VRYYDSSQPLIVIHIPKAAGSSSKEIFKSWFSDNFHQHYFNEKEGLMPKKIDIFKLNSSKVPLCLHGHFNKLRKFGVEDYYPSANQFVTILRDPYELLISHYFFVSKVGGNWKDQSRVPKSDIETYLRSAKPNMLNHFPREVTLENYKDICEEYFIEIGITEKLDQSLERIANKLGFEFMNNTPNLNKTDRDQEVAENFKDQFIESNRLEYEVYEYCLGKYI